jgi:opacity protein-like surface antigen
MRLKATITGATALALLAFPALAADPVPPPEVAPAVMADAPAPAFSWTGGYIGGHAGLGRGAIDNGTSCWKWVREDTGTGEGDWEEFPIYFIAGDPWEEHEDGGIFCRQKGVFVGALGPTDLDWDDEDFVKFAVGEPSPIAGYLAGAQIGFNLQLGQGRVGFVIGAEVSHSITSLAADLDGYLRLRICGCREIHVGWNSEFRINSITTATLRAGLALGRVLVYGEGGLALVNATWVNDIGFSDTVTDHGHVFGAGIEVALNDNISIFGEWNRVVIPEHQFLGQINDPIVMPLAIDVSSRTDLFKIGFNIRVGQHH